MEQDPILGEVVMFAGSFEPANWKFCNGQMLSVNQYTALFTLLEYTWGGGGDEFALPDLRGRVPLHYGQGPGLDNIAFGQKGGVEQVTLTSKHIPPHSHPLDGVSELATTNVPSKDMSVSTASIDSYATDPYPISPVPAIEPFNEPPKLVNMDVLSISASETGGKPVSIVQPYQAINFIIAVEGVFPSRP